MFYLIFGNDNVKSHKKFDEIVAEVSGKDKNLSVFRFDNDNFELEEFRGAFKTESLFLEKKLILSKRIFNNSLAKEYVLGSLEEINNSKNVLIFLEEKIKPTELKELQAHTKNIFEYSFDKRDERKKQLSIYFKITDLVAERKKNDVWLLFQEEVLKGIDTEEVFFKVLWQIRNLLVVKKGGGKDLHSFVYKKTQKNTSLFKEGELEKFLSELVVLYHKNRRGAGDLKIGLEKFLLSI
ncbi:hypothetical protein ACFLZC_01630 [Patescibacteria group bacterium]